ncbi:MAG: hypothetical protein JWQ87_4755 [Candidatus Sulfotelmatobacter sp.]|nr:hypothetical protein [Candidatus Sulfotelmatobacter sp.]
MRGLACGARFQIAPRLLQHSPVFNGWKDDSPKRFYPIVLFGKLNCVSGDSLEASQLRDDPSRKLSATLISHDQVEPISSGVPHYGQSF